MLSKIGISREQNLYITNTVFWRPPGNRKPNEFEIALCRPFVEKHIYLIKPKIIILAGSTAVHAILGKDKQITKTRQLQYQYTNRYIVDSITTVSIFHPAYLLRQPLKKKDDWFDILALQALMDKMQIVR